MCLAIPGKILNLFLNDGEIKMAKVDFGGIRRNICVDWIDSPACGEYILAHAGVALCKVDTDEALETLNDFKILAQQMKQIHESDLRI